MSLTALQDRIDRMRNPSVVGLDPTHELIPSHLFTDAYIRHGETLKAVAEASLEFGKQIIDAVADVVPAVKPQAAYYERLGPDGMVALRDVAEYAKDKGMYVIADAKRNDIGSTAVAYSSGLLGCVEIGKTMIPPYKFDAVTVNGYLGRDGIAPFIKDAKLYDKALFVLVKTSNPSSGDIQDLRLERGGTVYEAMADLIAELSEPDGHAHIGAVVGATYPAELAALRTRLPRTFFLVPGYGAQGGTAADIVGAFGADRRGAVVNSSRGIIGAWKHTGGDGRGFADAARSAALHMRDQLRESLNI